MEDGAKERSKLARPFERQVSSPTNLTNEEFERTKRLVLRYLEKNPSINNTGVRQLTGINYDQATRFFGRMASDGILQRKGKTSGTKYVLPSR